MDSKTKEILQKFSTQKVDLGLQEDLQKQIKKSDKIVSNAERVSDAAEQASNIAKKTLSDLSQLKKQMESTLGQVDKQAKELGIKPNSIKSYDKANRVWLQLAQYESYLQRAVKNIRSLIMS